jgi:hypothetical protein
MNIDALYHWVTESTRNDRLPGNKVGITIEKRIQRLIDEQEPITEPRILYRIQLPNSPKIIPYSWFSTSNDVNKVLEQHLAKNADCCLFKIHVLPGIRILDVDDTLKINGKKETVYDESEIIVNGGGIFTHSSNKNGFLKIGKTKGVTTYETFYGLPMKFNVKNKINPNTIFNSILINEYELINSANNVKNIFRITRKNKNNKNVNNTVYENVWQRIKKIKNKSKGGRRNTR